MAEVNTQNCCDDQHLIAADPEIPKLILEEARIQFQHTLISRERLIKKYLFFSGFCAGLVLFVFRLYFEYHAINTVLAISVLTLSCLYVLLVAILGIRSSRYVGAGHSPDIWRNNEYWSWHPNQFNDIMACSYLNKTDENRKIMSRFSRLFNWFLYSYGFVGILLFGLFVESS